MIHTLLPCQYREPAGARLALPQRRLMLAVLQAVIDDVHGGVLRRTERGSGAVDRRDEDRAWAYLRSDDRAWPYSFENVCESLGVDSSSLRRALEGAGPPVPRCADEAVGYSTSAALKSGEPALV